MSLGELKPGAIWNPSAALANAQGVAAAIFASLGVTMVITSGTDGVHGAGSLHAGGNAMDLRRWDLDAKGATSQAVSMLKSQLGVDFDVVLESDHIHVEYDPKGGNASGGGLGSTSISIPAIIGIGLFALLLLRR